MHAIVAGTKTKVGVSRFFIHLPNDQRKAIREEITDGSSPVIRYWVMIALSTTIAAYGLLSNSAAVIIGAMLVAPLMGPIFGIALGLVSGNNLLLRRALVAESLGIALAVAIGWGVGALPLNLGTSSEMLGRTAPTLYDLLIAIASGLAGAYASVNVKISAALPGVAISVALVPPLATSGLFLAVGDYPLAGGAFLLFTANLFAIQIAASLVFIVHELGGTREIRKQGLVRFLVRFAPGLLGTVAMGVFMTQTLRDIYADRQLDERVRDVLSHQINLRTGGNLDEILERRKVDDTIQVVAVALTPQPFEPKEVKQMEDALAERTGRSIRLILRSLVSRDTDRSGQVFRNDAEREASQRMSEAQSLLSDATETVREGLANIPGANLESLQRRESIGDVSLIAIVRTPVAVDPALVKSLQDQLEDRLARKTVLVVRSVLTRDADSVRYIYDPQQEAVPPLPRAEIALRTRVADVVARRMGLIPGARVIETSVSGANGTRTVNVIVEAPRPITPEEVAPLQADLRKFVIPGVLVQVRTRVVGVAGAGGWVLDGQGLPE